MGQLLSSSLSLLVALFCLVAPTRAQAEIEEPCANKKPSVGEYRNLPHGFSIIIPDGLKGYWTSIGCESARDDCICKTDDGRRIRLGADAIIDITAFYDPMDFEFWPPNGEYNKLKELRREKHVNKVKLLSSGWIPLSEVKVYRYVIRFRRNKTMFIHDMIVGIHEKVVYELIMYTLADRYETDKISFEKIIASWRWTPRIGFERAALNKSLNHNGWCHFRLIK